MIEPLSPGSNSPGPNLNPKHLIMKLAHLFLGITVLLLAVSGYLAIQNRQMYLFEKYKSESLQSQLDEARRVPVQQYPPQPAPARTVAPDPEETELPDDLKRIEKKLFPKPSDSLTATEEDFNAIKAELAAEEAKDKEIESKLLEMEQNNPVKLTKAEQKIMAADAIAKVTAVNEQHGFATIDAGSDKNLQQGMEFAIRRDRYIVGQVTVGNLIDPVESVVVPLPGTIPAGVKIVPGDELIAYDSTMLVPGVQIPAGAAVGSPAAGSASVSSP